MGFGGPMLTLLLKVLSSGSRTSMENTDLFHIFTDECLGKWIADLVTGMGGQSHHLIYLVVQIA